MKSLIVFVIIAGIASTLYAFSNNWMKLIRVFFLSGTIFLGCFDQAFSQSGLDSLTKILSKYDNNDSNKVKTLQKIGYLYFSMDSLSDAESYYQKSLELAKKMDFTKGINIAAGNLGVIYLKNGNFDKALSVSQEALNAILQNGTSSQASRMYNTIGAIYRTKGENTKALEAYYHGLELAEKSNDETNLIALYGNVGIIYEEEADYDEAEDWLLKCLKYAKKGKNNEDILSAYMNLGLLRLAQKDYKGSLENYEYAIGLVRPNDQHSRSIILNNIGSIFVDQKNYDAALKKFDTVLAISRITGNAEILAGAYSNLAIIFLNKRLYEQSLAYCDSTLRYAKIYQIRKLELSAFETRSSVYEQKKDYKSAFDSQREFLKLNDSLHNVFDAKRSQWLTDKYQYAQLREREKKLAEEHELSERIKWYQWYAGVGMVLFTVLIAIFYLRHRKFRHPKIFRLIIFVDYFCIVEFIALIFHKSIEHFTHENPAYIVFFLSIYAFGIERYIHPYFDRLFDQKDGPKEKIIDQNDEVEIGRS